MAETKPDKNKETKSPLGKKPNTPKVQLGAFWLLFYSSFLCSLFF